MVNAIPKNVSGAPMSSVGPDGIAVRRKAPIAVKAMGVIAKPQYVTAAGFAAAQPENRQAASKEAKLLAAMIFSNIFRSSGPPLSDTTDPSTLSSSLSASRLTAAP